MIGIKKKVYILKCFHSTDVLLAPIQRKTLKIFFFLHLPISVYFTVGNSVFITNIQTILDLSPRVLEHLLCYHSHVIPYEGPQL